MFHQHANQYCLQIDLAVLQREDFSNLHESKSFILDDRKSIAEQFYQAISEDLGRARTILERYEVSAGSHYGPFPILARQLVSEGHDREVVWVMNQKVRISGFGNSLRWALVDSRKLRKLSENVSRVSSDGILASLTD